MDKTVLCDARGLICPLPVLKAAKTLAALPDGGSLRLLADDPMARIDIPNFCREKGYHLVEEDAGRWLIAKPVA
jgi:tRNA 2-thiouridine synthesizing protein A